MSAQFVAKGATRFAAPIGRVLSRFRRAPRTSPAAAAPSVGPSGGVTSSGLVIPPTYGSSARTAAARSAVPATSSAPRTTLGEALWTNRSRRGRAGVVLGGLGAGLATQSEPAQRGLDWAKGYEQFALPEDAYSPVTAEDLRSQRLEDFDAMQQSYRDALNQVLGDDSFAERERQKSEQIASAMGGWGSARAQGIEESYGRLAEEQDASVAAIEQIAGLAEEVFGEDNESTRAAVTEALYGDAATEASGLAPISGAAADMPGQFAAEGDIAAREALANILGEASGSRFAADTAQRYGQAYADQLRDQIAMEQFGMQSQSQAAINAELARREQLAQGLEVDMLGMRSGIDVETQQAVREEQNIRRQVLTEVAQSPSLQSRYSREWNKVIRDTELAALWRAQGVETFEDFVVAKRLSDLNSAQG